MEVDDDNLTPRAQTAEHVREMTDAIYRAESRRVFATLVRLLGDFDLAEEALHDAFRAALEQWPRDGVPANPRAWLVSAGRFKAIDGIRRRSRFDSMEDVAEQVEAVIDETASWDGEAIEDDRLRLIFTCCHPSLAPDAQVALTLREVCGLTTEEIAQAFLSAAPTLAQRIVRAKAKIRDARIPYQVPEPDELAERLDSVLRVIYLVFNEGYSASSGQSLTRVDLSGEAIRLGRLLVELLPEPEAIGLLALMLLQESRRAARASHDGRAGPAQRPGPLALEPGSNRRGVGAGDKVARVAAPRSLHAPGGDRGGARRCGQRRRHGLGRDRRALRRSARIEPTPVVELNRAVAIAMRDGPAAGLALIEAILARGDLKDYHLAHAARADLCRRLGKTAQARASYKRAIALARQGPERRFLERRLAELPD